MTQMTFNSKKQAISKQCKWRDWNYWKIWPEIVHGTGGLDEEAPRGLAPAVQKVNAAPGQQFLAGSTLKWKATKDRVKQNKHVDQTDKT